MAIYVCMEVVGRVREKELLEQALRSQAPELLVVYGRRRVGKTFLIRNHLASQLSFEITGMYEVTLKQQLANFHQAFVRSSGRETSATPTNWVMAFAALSQWLDEAIASSPDNTQKRVLFFDELPWLATKRSGFLSAFEHFWNSWASRRQDMLIVICGSAASWMIRNVINHRGGLHNRVTRQMLLEPLCLAETRTYLESRGVQLGEYQCLELFMAFGGIPYYLNCARPGMSAAQIVEQACFAKDGILRHEFKRVFASLFEHYERHVQVCRALATKRSGLTRNEIIGRTDLSSGGTATKTLDELEQSGFLMVQRSFGKNKRAAIYRLADEYSLFYLQWIEGRADSTGDWQKLRGSPAWRAWSGIAFEGICIKHVGWLKSALGIGAVETTDSSWSHRPVDASDEGAQIDLVINRKDGCVNLCEMKFSESEFVIDKAYAKSLRNKRGSFARITKTRKTLFLTMVTTYGVRENQHYSDLGITSITMSSLFQSSRWT
ncbi:MAG: AAA family ATPase [Kofleriaceae bacterium]|nr:AAA family ATPase [Kofleriaceae bacterium]